MPIANALQVEGRLTSRQSFFAVLANFVPCNKLLFPHFRSKFDMPIDSVTPIS